MGRDCLSFQAHKATEIYPGVILGGLRDLDDILALKPDVLVPLDRVPGTIWEDGYCGEILYIPIVDESILPEHILESFIDQLLEHICDKRRIAIFCIGGHGRTGYIASCLLYRLGIKNPIAYIRKNYCMHFTKRDIGDAELARIAAEHVSDPKHLEEIMAGAADPDAAETAERRLGKEEYLAWAESIDRYKNH